MTTTRDIRTVVFVSTASGYRPLCERERGVIPPPAKKIINGNILSPLARRAAKDNAAAFSCAHTGCGEPNPFGLRRGADTTVVKQPPKAAKHLLIIL